ncbi:PIN domain-containing protein [Halocatena pleomorpha]|nr:PIN domain-containing protein [Halocatena pleomorpha]
MILDTNCLVALRDSDDGAKTKSAELEATGLSLRLPSIVVWEFSFGAEAR